MTLKNQLNHYLLTFVIKTINTINACAFMVATQDEKIFRIFYFISQQKTNGF
jgi:hypothetical protein